MQETCIVYDSNYFTLELHACVLRGNIHNSIQSTWFSATISLVTISTFTYVNSNTGTTILTGRRAHWSNLCIVSSGIRVDYYAE